MDREQGGGAVHQSTASKTLFIIPPHAVFSRTSHLVLPCLAVLFLQNNGRTYFNTHNSIVQFLRKAKVTTVSIVKIDFTRFTKKTITRRAGTCMLPGEVQRRRHQTKRKVQQWSDNTIKLSTLVDDVCMTITSGAPIQRTKQKTTKATKISCFFGRHVIYCNPFFVGKADS